MNSIGHSVCCEVLLDFIIMWHKFIYTTSVIKWLQCCSNTKFNESLNFAGINTPQCTASQTQAPVS